MPKVCIISHPLIEETEHVYLKSSTIDFYRKEILYKYDNVAMCSMSLPEERGEFNSLLEKCHSLEITR